MVIFCAAVAVHFTKQAAMSNQFDTLTPDLTMDVNAFA